MRQTLLNLILTCYFKKAVTHFQYVYLIPVTEEWDINEIKNTWP